MDEGVTIGPMINDTAVAKVHRLVKAAKASGAKSIAGGKKMDGNFYDPTLLVDVTPDMDISKEEIFGPVATLIRFTTDEEAVSIANDTPFGLAAYFYSRDIGRCWRVSEGLEYGMVGINSGILSTELAPFGGIKESGIGREGSYYGIEDWVEVKYLCMGDV